MNDGKTFEIPTFSMGLATLLYHLEKLPEVKIKSKFSYPMTDDCWAQFTYKGFPFSIDSPNAYLWIHADAENMPGDLLSEIETHVQQYNPYNLFQIPGRLFHALKYLFYPIPKWHEEK